jgi:hypothetical protein
MRELFGDDIDILPLCRPEALVGLTVFEGSVCPHPLSVPMRRLVRLSEVALRLEKSGNPTNAEIIREYRDAYDDDETSQRLLSATIAEFRKPTGSFP